MQIFGKKKEKKINSKKYG